MNHPMRRWLDAVQPLCEAGEAAVSTALLQQAAYDFLHDWRQIPEGHEADEPQPRRGFIKTLRQQGLDPDASSEDDLMAALIAVMRPEATRFLKSLPWQRGKLIVYRNINVPEGWERDPEQSVYGGGGLGVFWATTETWGGNITIVSQVRPNQVDWSIVVLKHLTYSENEIRIKDNQKVPILRAYRWDNGKVTERNVTHLAGKLFSVGERSDEWPD